jgi:hypothetical protein
MTMFMSAYNTASKEVTFINAIYYGKVTLELQIKLQALEGHLKAIYGTTIKMVEPCSLFQLTFTP